MFKKDCEAEKIIGEVIGRKEKFLEKITGRMYEGFRKKECYM